MNLVDLEIGKTASIQGFSEKGNAQQARLFSLGLVPGAKIRVVRTAPLGCPMQVKVGSTLLSIRRAEAEVVLVED
jgi:ferrous iron transport protein A